VEHRLCFLPERFTSARLLRSDGPNMDTEDSLVSLDISAAMDQQGHRRQLCRWPRLLRSDGPTRTPKTAMATKCRRVAELPMLTAGNVMAVGGVAESANETAKPPKSRKVTERESLLTGGYAQCACTHFQCRSAPAARTRLRTALPGRRDERMTSCR
jgi:hypothetical protein